MRKNSIKNIRINEEVMRELSNIIRGEIKDPRINPMTSGSCSGSENGKSLYQCAGG